MTICSSYRCALTQHQCAATLLRAKLRCSLISAALQDWLASGLSHCTYTYDDFLNVQVCTDPTPVHSNTVQGKLQCPLISAALQDWLSSGLSHCTYTYDDLLFIQVCTDPTPVCCNTAQGKIALLVDQCCSARLACIRLESLHLHL